MVLRLITQLHRFIQGPCHCPICLQPSATNLCYSCQQNLRLETQARCQTCGLAIAEPGICGKCQTQQPAFDRSYCLADYAWPYDQLLKSYKYRKQRHLVTSFAQLFFQQHPMNNIKLPDALCYVPLHWFKYWQRGFNQSEEFARLLAAHYRLPLGDYLHRHRYGKVQASLKANQRARALALCFNLKTSAIPEHVAIIDDVVTTTSTANVLARLLKQGGAKQVDLWFICRTP